MCYWRGRKLFTNVLICYAQGMYNLSLSGLSSTCHERSLSKRWQKNSALPFDLLRDLIYTFENSNSSHMKQKVASGNFQKILFLHKKMHFSASKH